MKRYKSKVVAEDFVPFIERLTPEKRAEFRRGMAAIRRKFRRRMKRRHNAPRQPRRNSGVGLDAVVGGKDGV